jgi:hypothetical protein
MTYYIMRWTRPTGPRTQTNGKKMPQVEALVYATTGDQLLASMPQNDTRHPPFIADRLKGLSGEVETWMRPPGHHTHKNYQMLPVL